MRIVIDDYTRFVEIAKTEGKSVRTLGREIIQDWMKKQK